MSQQINLLSREKLAYSPLVIASLVWLSVIVFIFVIWSVNHFRLVAAIESEAVAATELADARKIIKDRDDRRAVILAQISTVRPRAEAASKLLDLARQLGRVDGFSSYFFRLAEATLDGLWLVKIDVGSGGRSLQVEGLSLRDELVMGFASGMNSAFADEGMKFSVLEIIPQQVSKQKKVGSEKDRDMPPEIPTTRFVVR